MHECNVACSHKAVAVSVWSSNDCCYPFLSSRYTYTLKITIKGRKKHVLMAHGRGACAVYPKCRARPEQVQCRQQHAWYLSYTTSASRPALPLIYSLCPLSSSRGMQASRWSTVKTATRQHSVPAADGCSHLPIALVRVGRCISVVTECVERSITRPVW